MTSYTAHHSDMAGSPLYGELPFGELCGATILGEGLFNGCQERAAVGGASGLPLVSTPNVYWAMFLAFSRRTLEWE
jgi:hypothetical protein